MASLFQLTSSEHMVHGYFGSDNEDIGPGFCSVSPQFSIIRWIIRSDVDLLFTSFALGDGKPRNTNTDFWTSSHFISFSCCLSVV